jgi:hypothetical protein
MQRALLLTVPFALLALWGCTPVDRDPACIAADACDQALERPFGDFGAQDLAFGDDLNGDGEAGDVGTCWQNADTAAPCVAACQDFLAEQQELARAVGNVAVLEACGGSLE